MVVGPNFEDIVGSEIPWEPMMLSYLVGASFQKKTRRVLTETVDDGTVRRRVYPDFIFFFFSFFSFLFFLLPFYGSV